jgi:putative transposase
VLQQRLLETICAVVFLDAFRVKICDESIPRNKPIFLTLVVRCGKARGVSSLWIEQAERVKFLPPMANDLKLRGVQDILVALTDG